MNIFSKKLIPQAQWTNCTARTCLVTIAWLVPVGNSNEGMLCQVVFVFICVSYNFIIYFNILCASGIVKN